jgi:hypothetical protein
MTTVAGIKLRYQEINYHINEELQINNIETVAIEIDIESLLKGRNILKYG